VAPVLQNWPIIRRGGSPTKGSGRSLDERIEQEQQQMTRVLSFLTDDKGATAIEYALIAGGISIVILAAVLSLGTNVNALFTSVYTSLK
jgi:pilus assembly protein Flp/PilA